jgi:hypothetical protein
MEQANLSIRARDCKCSNCSKNLSLKEIEFGYSLLCSACFDRDVTIAVCRETKETPPPRLRGLGNKSKK